MEKSLLFYLLRAIGACKDKKYRKIDAPDDMAAVHVDMEFLFEAHEINFILRFVEDQMTEDGYTDKVRNMCAELRKVLKSK